MTEYESTKIQRALDILKGVVEREDKRHMMDEQLTASMRNLLEHEVIPQLENELDYDPTPQTAYDFFH
jgi:vacuolar-type H+-ATPase subunit D/Vma8|tara:strand:- start:1569 stop:1772 length:204 start_codon:yes stop_codon:yes gene_type:complete